MSIRKYDVEAFADELVQILKDNLSTKLTEVTTQKGDGLVLATVNTTSGYFFQTLNETVINMDPYIFYGVDEVATDGEPGPTSAKEPTIVFWLVKEDDAQDLDIARRMLRYSRAMEEVFQDNFDKARRSGIIKVKAFAPVQFKLGINSVNESRVAAVAVTGQFA